MGVWIEGMEKPKNCCGCFLNESDMYCHITKSYIDRDDYTTEKPYPMHEVSDVVMSKVYK